MQEKDIAVASEYRKNLPEECMEAYKDIEKVIKAQKGLITPLKRLSPIAVIKG